MNTMATVVIVPGSFCPTAIYDNLHAELTKQAIENVVVTTPSVGRREGGPAATLTDDVDEISRIVKELLGEGKEVVILAHSYGGVPSAQSMQHVSKKARAAAGLPGGVEKMVYLAASILAVGESQFRGASEEDVGEMLGFDNGYMELRKKDAVASNFFNDLTFEQALEWANKLSCHSKATFTEPLAYPGYDDVEMHYILCEDDRTIPPALQMSMIGLAEASSGRKVAVHRLKSDHMPMASRSGDVVEIVKRVI